MPAQTPCPDRKTTFVATNLNPEQTEVLQLIRAARGKALGYSEGTSAIVRVALAQLAQSLGIPQGTPK